MAFSWKNRLVLLLAVTTGIWGGVARASDHGSSEGVVNNRGLTPLYCFKDLKPDGTALCILKILPGETCYADAVGPGPGKPVYKLPNYTEYDCAVASGDESPKCGAAGRQSAVLTVVANIKAKLEGEPNSYGSMPWSRFYDLMKGGEFGDPLQLVKCDKAGKSITPQFCPAPELFSGELQSVEKAAAVLSSQN